MVGELPEQLLEQAKFLLTLPPTQANLRRAVSAAYYSLFHLLIRATVQMWNEPLHQARMARIFEHERMKKVSGAVIKSAGIEKNAAGPNPMDAAVRTELITVAESFIILQQARHNADYNLEMPLDPAEAAAWVARAHTAFASWETCRASNAAKEYLFSLLFRETDRT